MYEGISTSRRMQITAGILLGFLTSLCLFVGIVGLYAILFFQHTENITLIISLIFTPMGLIGLLIAKRLILAKGVTQGAGLLSPNEYKYVGYFFIAISIFLIVYGINHSTIKHIYLAPAPLLLTYLCFTAARFRGSMKNTPKWRK